MFSSIYRYFTQQTGRLGRLELFYIVAAVAVRIFAADNDEFSVAAVFVFVSVLLLVVAMLRPVQLPAMYL